jgi:iron complex outermembrane receptor protein
LVIRIYIHAGEIQFMLFNKCFVPIARVRYALVAALLFVFIIPTTHAQTGGSTVRGTVTFAANGDPVHNATVLLTPSGRTTETDEQGNYEFANVAPGNYGVIAKLPRVPDAVTRINVNGTDAVTADLALRLSGVREEVTVTASSAEETTLNAIRPTTVVDAIELTERAHTSIGEVLENQPGVAKRSFGPGSSRPVIRGFDGDRILVLQDNLPVSS